MAAKLSELAFHLRRMRKGKGRAILAAKVEAVDLILNDHPRRQWLERSHEIAHRLGAIARSVVNRLHQSHLPPPLAGPNRLLDQLSSGLHT
jgi:hypothetical protein